MKDKRKFLGSISVKIDTKRRRLELAAAENFGGPAGWLRLRLDRRWHDAPDGSPLFLAREQLADLVAQLVLGETPALPPLPEIPLRTRVYARYQYRGEWESAVAYTSSPPIRGQDGQVYVGVNLFGGPGYRFLPLADLTVIQTAGQLRRFTEERARKAAELRLDLEA